MTVTVCCGSNIDGGKQKKDLEGALHVSLCLHTISNKDKGKYKEQRASLVSSLLMYW